MPITTKRKKVKLPFFTFQVPRPTVGAAGYGPAKTARKRPSGNLCGQPTKAGGTCRRVVATVPCPDHPAGRPGTR